MQPARPTLPPSDTHLAVNALGLVACVLALWGIRAFAPDLSLTRMSLIVMAATAAPILIADLLVFKVYRRASARLGAKNPADARRVAVKWLGLVGTLGFIGLLYWVFPEYHGSFYDRYYHLMRYAIPALLVLAVPYFWLLDGRQTQPRDGYYNLGLVMLNRADGADLSYVGRHLRDWTVKGFFFPLMFLYLGGNAQNIVHQDFGKIDGFIPLYDFLYNFIFFADLIFAAVGYAMTFQFLDSHIRSSEPTVFGWVVAVMCYAPFWNAVFYGGYFAYDDGYYWGHWLRDHETAKILWGSAILVLITIYASATVCLGYRFSNLTYRGLVSNGAYRFSKHPAYVAKNLSWWMVSIPFISQHGFGDAIRHCLMLGGVNTIYFLRARTEERHLSRYPEYVAYALAMNERSIFRGLAKVIPALKYKAPAAA